MRDKDTRRPDMATRFKPGQSGNPRGRPPGAKHGILATMRLLGKKHPLPEVKRIMEARGIDLEDGTNNDAVSWSILLNALSGDNQAAGNWMKADDEPKAIELTGRDGGPMEHDIAMRPPLTREEWEKKHGLDTSSGTTTGGD